MVDYPGCTADNDLNCFEESDIEDLTLSMIGTAMKVVAGLIGLIVLIVVLAFLAKKFNELKGGAGKLGK